MNIVLSIKFNIWAGWFYMQHILIGLVLSTATSGASSRVPGQTCGGFAVWWQVRCLPPSPEPVEVLVRGSVEKSHNLSNVVPCKNVRAPCTIKILALEVLDIALKYLTQCLRPWLAILWGWKHPKWLGWNCSNLKKLPWYFDLTIISMPLRSWWLWYGTQQSTFHSIYIFPTGYPPPSSLDWPNLTSGALGVLVWLGASSRTSPLLWSVCWGSGDNKGLVRCWGNSGTSLC